MSWTHRVPQTTTVPKPKSQRKKATSSGKSTSRNSSAKSTAIAQRPRFPKVNPLLFGQFEGTERYSRTVTNFYETFNFQPLVSGESEWPLNVLERFSS